jgi:hypothetical protein
MNQTEQATRSVAAYGLGMAEYDPQDERALAKVVHDEELDRRSYWLKIAVAGPEAGSLHNHHSPYYVGDARQRQRGTMTYEWKKVTREAYEAYLRFLKTDQLVHLRHAQGLLNG